MNSKKTFKIVIAIIILILIIAVIFVTRKFIIISQIVERYTEIEKLDNYSFIAKQNINGQQTIVEYQRKGDKISAKIGEEMLWHDESTNENIAYFPENLSATIGAGNSNLSIFENFEKPFKTENTFLNKLKVAIISKISSDEINGKKCYVVVGPITSTTCYYSVEDKTILRFTTDSENVCDYEWEFNQVLDEDVARPNLEGFNVIDNNK